MSPPSSPPRSPQDQTTPMIMLARETRSSDHFCSGISEDVPQEISSLNTFTGSASGSTEGSTDSRSKWKTKKYQRMRRNFERGDEKQLVITSFFPIITQVQKLVDQELDLKTELLQNVVFRENRNLPVMLLASF